MTGFNHEPIIHPERTPEHIKGRPSPVVCIEHLSIALPAGADRAFAVERVNFKLYPGEILCVVGESGSGKSMSANALMGAFAGYGARRARPHPAGRRGSSERATGKTL